ncbi:hypothetical protein ON010_g7994 [Phytophthora cinnamomi]|nr:hypothetical protein ON010_g7994 [Phytophthora cinnamomi]
MFSDHVRGRRVVLEGVGHTVRRVLHLVARARVAVVGGHAVGLRAVGEGALHVAHLVLLHGDVGHAAVAHGPDLHGHVARRDGEARVPEHGALHEAGQVVEVDVERVQGGCSRRRHGRERHAVARVARLVADVELPRDVRVAAVEDEGGGRSGTGGRSLRLQAAERDGLGWSEAGDGRQQRWQDAPLHGLDVGRVAGAEIRAVWNVWDFEVEVALLRCLSADY